MRATKGGEQFWSDKNNFDSTTDNWLSREIMNLAPENPALYNSIVATNPEKMYLAKNPLWNWPRRWRPPRARAGKVAARGRQRRRGRPRPKAPSSETTRTLWCIACRCRRCCYRYQRLICPPIIVRFRIQSNQGRYTHLKNNRQRQLP